MDKSANSEHTEPGGSSVDGTQNKSGQITAFAELLIKIRDHSEQIDLAITDLKGQIIFLGHDWLARHNLLINWNTPSLRKLPLVPYTAGITIYILSSCSKALCTAWHILLSVQPCFVRHPHPVLVSMLLGIDWVYWRPLHVLPLSCPWHGYPCKFAI